MIKRFQRRKLLCGLETGLVVLWSRNGCSFFCPKSLPEAKVKGFGSVLLAEEISKQSSIDSVMWLLVLTMMKIYNEKEQVELHT